MFFYSSSQVQGSNYASFYDDQRQTWSLGFDSDKNVINFAKQVLHCATSRKVQIKYFLFGHSLPLLHSPNFYWSDCPFMAGIKALKSNSVSFEFRNIIHFPKLFHDVLHNLPLSVFSFYLCYELINCTGQVTNWSTLCQ